MTCARETLVKPTRRRLRDLRGATDGATIIEFAFVVAPFIALLLAVLQTTLIYFTQEAVETGVEAAARSVMTGQAQAKDSTGASAGMTQAQLQARFQQTACAALPTYLSCPRLYVDVRSATNWSAMNTTMPTIVLDANGNVTNQFSYSLGNQGSVVMVRLMYVWPLQGSPIQLGLSNIGGGERLIVATSVAKTETYS